MGLFSFNYCRITKTKRRIVFWTKTRLQGWVFLDLTSTSFPDAITALYRNLSLLTLNSDKMFLVIAGCLLAMAVFISKLPDSVSFCLTSLITLAGSLEWLCSVYRWVPGTFLAEAFAKVKMNLKHGQTGKRQTSKWGKIGFTSLITWSAVRLLLHLLSFRSTAQMTRYPFTTGSNKDSLSHNFSRTAPPSTSLKWTMCYWFLHNSSHFWGPDFWSPEYINLIQIKFLS